MRKKWAATGKFCWSDSHTRHWQLVASPVRRCAPWCFPKSARWFVLQPEDEQRTNLSKTLTASNKCTHRHQTGALVPTRDSRLASNTPNTMPFCADPSISFQNQNLWPSKWEIASRFTACWLLSPSATKGRQPHCCRCKLQAAVEPSKPREEMDAQADQRLPGLLLTFTEEI